MSTAITSTEVETFNQRHEHGPQPGQTGTTKDGHTVELYARAWLPTRYGEFTIFSFRNSKDGKEHVALVKGDVWNHKEVPFRLHSECLTGDVFTSLKCDCREQLERALETVSKLDVGGVLYMRQEGRGIGLGNKIKAYALQEQGFDTVEANKHLGFDDDLREYDVAAEMFKILAPQSVVLMTNNPRKVKLLSEAGVNISSRAPIQIDPNPHNHFYLKTKRARSGHLLELV
jgi:GTP cyclohydrolase II